MDAFPGAYAYFLGAGVARRRRYGSGRGVIVVLRTATFLVRSAWWDSEDIVLQEALANDQGLKVRRNTIGG